MDDTNNSQNPNAKGSKRPSHIAYNVREGDEGKSYFNRVGSAFEHGDGKGFNILLDSTPVNGKVTLRTVEDRMKAAKEKRNGQSSKSDRGYGR